jgi:hypothetical protein
MLMQTQDTIARQTPRFTVVPPGPVTDRVEVELRLAVPNDAPQARTFKVRFYYDKVDPRHLIAAQTVTAPPNGFAFASAWRGTAHLAGKRLLLYQVESDAGVDEGKWSLEVVESGTTALPVLQGVWIEPFAALRASEGADAATIERNIRASVDAMKRLGMNVLVIAYVEYHGTFFYPSHIEFFDRDAKRLSRGKDCPFDVVGTILSQADKNGMHVFLGIGRGGDTHLLWEFEKEGWHERNAEAIALGKRVAKELWERYGHRPSFYGWYFTHEMNDLAKASAYYNPLADYCHSLSPDKPVLVAPAGTPIIDRKSLSESRVDIFAYQDAVGAGYVPYRYTFNPEKRMAVLDDIFARYKDWHAGTRKHLWSDLEIWEMDGSQGYGGAYPAPFSRVKKQIEIESRFVEMLTGYAYFGFMQPPVRNGPRAVPRRAVRLFEEYVAYLKERNFR